LVTVAVIDRQSSVKSSVSGDDKWRVAILEIGYGREFSAGPDESSELSQELIAEYEYRRSGKRAQEPAPELSPPLAGKEKATSTSCVVVLDANTAGSPLLKALRNLHSRVSSEKGNLAVVGFPPRFIALLNSLGLPSYKDFLLSRDKDSAVAEVRSRESS
jgi:hypothetical protein